ncbi:hypothetical protein C7M51_02192 [Mixta intestinalis]|uniref:Virulence effector protein n=2 Tax=Mixta intestinalis TaxID=1615494 RepID=A0A6P1Q1A8_9GAMM|nr:hypothetical protein C7M51_02192 [Mixta intestinalis]
MKEMFLCSDRLNKYQAMGENGQAVHISALQLRETLRLRKQGAVADMLGIPQINEHGDRIDWYAPFSGDVVPWSAATDSERQAALAQLEMNQTALRQLSDELRRNEQPEQRLFGQLLEKALQFPDDRHIWLVAGKPVISFWGFVNARHQMRLDPLDCLRPAPPLTSPVTASTAVPEIDSSVQKTTRHVRWWILPGWLRWLLPLLLLLLLALLLLRSCAPQPGLPDLSTERTVLPAEVVPHPDESYTATLTTPPDATLVTSTAIPALSGEQRLPEIVGEAVQDNLPPPRTDAIDPAFEPVVPAEPIAGEQIHQPVPDAASSDPVNNLPAPVDPDAVTNNSTVPAQTNAPLTLPAAALSQGNTDFLNGRWRAGAGIQDRRTGKPLRLNYQIKDGKGEVQMVRGDGVTCRAAVNAAVQSGTLAINNQEEAQCSDGSVYQMPDIRCAPGAQSVAECKGSYGANTFFPISMKQEASN